MPPKKRSPWSSPLKRGKKKKSARTKISEVVREPEPINGAESDHVEADNDGEDDVPQGTGSGDGPNQIIDDDIRNSGAESDTVAARPPPNRRIKGNSKNKSKGKATISQESAVEGSSRQHHSLTQEQEEELVEWMRENEGVWRRGSSLYKGRRNLWATKAEQFGVTIEHLEGWWKSAKDWFVRLMKKKSGDARKRLTDREQWILDRISFYTPQLKLNEAGGQPMCHLQRKEQQTQPDPLPLIDSDSDSDQPHPSQQPSQQSSAVGDQSLETLELNAAREAGEAEMRSCSRKQKSSKKRRQEAAEDQWMRGLRDSINANTALMEHLVKNKRPVSDREPFITYVQDSLRTLSDDDYMLVRANITSLLHNPTRTASEVERPLQSQSAPAGQFQPPTPLQQFFKQGRHPQQSPFREYTSLQQPDFNQAPVPQRSTSFSESLPPQLQPFLSQSPQLSVFSEHPPQLQTGFIPVPRPHHPHVNIHPPIQQETSGPSRSNESSFSQLLSSANEVLDVSGPMNFSADTCSIYSQLESPSLGRTSSQSLNTPPVLSLTGSPSVNTEKDGRTITKLQSAQQGSVNTDEDSAE